MSFSYSNSGPADVVRADIKARGPFEIPNSLKEFLLIGIHGLKERHGADVTVEVAVQGNLNHDGHSRDVSEAKIGVRKAAEAKKGEPIDRNAQPRDDNPEQRGNS